VAFLNLNCPHGFRQIRTPTARRLYARPVSRLPFRRSHATKIRGAG
jgi:hypothetical protein